MRLFYSILTLVMFGLFTLPASASSFTVHGAWGNDYGSIANNYQKKASSRKLPINRRARRKRVRVAALSPAYRTTYRPSSSRRTSYRSGGLASYYWRGQRVASGGRFNPNAMTAAHKTLPFGTRVKVTNKRNGRSVVVTINDRGPFIRGRVIDLSKGAARVIQMTGAGVVPVSLEIQ